MDVEKTIEFLLRWQAKFSADMEIMKANMAEQAAESRRSARRHEEWMLTSRNWSAATIVISKLTPSGWRA